MLVSLDQVRCLLCWSFVQEDCGGFTTIEEREGFYTLAGFVCDSCYETLCGPYGGVMVSEVFQIAERSKPHVGKSWGASLGVTAPSLSLGLGGCRPPLDASRGKSDGGVLR